MTDTVTCEISGHLASTKEDAVKVFFERMDRYPGRRRTPAEKAFHVVKVTADRAGKKKNVQFWFVHYRRN